MTEWWKREPRVEPDFALVYAEGYVDPGDLEWWDGPLIPVVAPKDSPVVYVLSLKGQTTDSLRDLALLIGALKDMPSDAQDRLVALLGA